MWGKGHNWFRLQVKPLAETVGAEFESQMVHGRKDAEGLQTEKAELY